MFLYFARASNDESDGARRAAARGPVAAAADGVAGGARAALRLHPRLLPRPGHCRAAHQQVQVTPSYTMNLVLHL